MIRALSHWRQYCFEFAHVRLPVGLSAYPYVCLPVILSTPFFTSILPVTFDVQPDILYAYSLCYYLYLEVALATLTMFSAVLGFHFPVTTYLYLQYISYIIMYFKRH